MFTKQEGKGSAVQHGDRAAFVRLVTTPELEALGLNPLTPKFNIMLEDQYLGYISRGHSLIQPAYAHQGYFAAALAKLETLERAMFQNGSFAAYREAIIESIGLDAVRAMCFVAGLKAPHHIEYWSYPSTAAYFLRRGYELAPFCIEQLQSWRVITGSSVEEMGNALRRNHKRLKSEIGMIYVLTKPALCAG